MSEIVGAWVIRPEDRYPIKYDYRGGETQFNILTDAFNSHKDAKLIDRVLESPLSNVYTAMKHFHYSSTVLHQLIVRSVYTDRDDELLFRFQNSICRFGRREFALITGLYFGPVQPDVRPEEDRERSSLIAVGNRDGSDVDFTRTPFILPVSRITIALLEKALKDATDIEIAYKIGLIYFIEVVLHGKPSGSHVSPFVFHLVDDTPRFLGYNWGSYFWDITLSNLKEKRDGLRSHIGRTSQVTKDVTCLVNSLFVWLYETLPSVGTSLARHVSNASPRMLRWHPKSGRVYNDRLEKQLEFKGLGVVLYLKESDVEIRMLGETGLAYDEINTPPPVYTIGKDIDKPCGNASACCARVNDIRHDDAHVDGVTDLELPFPSERGRNVSDTFVDSRLHTTFSGLRSDVSFTKTKIMKSVNELKEYARDNLENVENDVVYCRNFLRGVMQDTKHDIRNQFLKIHSDWNETVNSMNRLKDMVQCQTSSTPTNNHQQPLPDQHQDDMKSQKEKPITEAPNSNKEAPTRSPATYIPKRHQPPCPSKSPFVYHQEKMSIGVVKRGIDAIRNEASTSKKKSFLGDFTEVRPYTAQLGDTSPSILDSPMHQQSPLLCSDSPTPLPELEARLSEELVTNMCMGNTSTNDAIKIDGTKRCINISDSPGKPTPKRTIPALLPDLPRTRRATQRPSRLKDFIDPSSVERKKLKRYDPFRPIDLDKWREFRDWYNNPDAPMLTIDGGYCNFTSPLEKCVDPWWFEFIYTSKKWIDNTHVNMYLHLLKGRMQKHPSSFKRDVSIISNELGMFIGNMTARILRPPSKHDIAIMDAVKVLTKKDTVYTPWWFGGNHWVALVISLSTWDITVYDCMCGPGENRAMYQDLLGWSINFPMMLNFAPEFKDDSRLAKPFLVKQLGQDACPQMDGIGDCGVFTLKYIEHLILLNARLDDVTQDNMETFRDKICVDIFHKIVDL